MTMHIVYSQDHDGHKRNKDYTVEQTLGRRLCENKIAIPYSVHIDNLEAEKRKKAEAEAKKKAKDEKKARLLKERGEQERDKAISKTAVNRSKAIKK